MNSFVDDPRLTAYALGEVDEAERAEVESLLKRSPDARRWVESVQQTSARLSAALKEELLVTGYELRQANDELQITNGELHSDSVVAASSSTIDHRKSTFDNTARKRHRIVRLIPLALAASVAVASGVTYVAWKQFQNENVARLNSNIKLHQIGHGLSQYRYDYSPAIPTVVLADSTQSKKGDAASNMRTGLVQVTPAAGKQEVGSAVRTDLANLASNVDLDGSATDASVSIDTNADGQSDSSTTQAFAFAMAAPTRNPIAVQGPNDPQPWYEQLRYPDDSLPENLSDAVETMDAHDAETDNFVLFSYVDETLYGQSARIDSAPQIGLTTKPNTDLRYSTGNSQGRNSSLEEERNQISQSIGELKSELAGIDQYRKIYRNGPVITAEDRQLATQDAEVSAMLAAKWQLEKDRSAIESNSGTDQTEVKDIDRTIAAVKKQLEAQRAEKQADLKRAVDAAYESTERAIALAQDRLERTDTALSEAREQDQLYAQGRVALIEVPAPGSGQSVFGGATHFVDPVTNQPVLPAGRAFHKIGLDPEHATYDIRVPKGQYGSITTRDQSDTQPTVADDTLPILPVGSSGPSATLISSAGGPVEVIEDKNGDPYYFTGGMLPLANSQNRDNESLNADLLFAAGTTVTATMSNIENIVFRDMGSVATTLNATSWSGVSSPIVDVTTQAAIVSREIDFSANPNISFGYQVPFGPPGAQPLAGNSAHEYLRSWDGFPIGYDIDPRTAESYDPVIEIPFLFVENQPLSTFSIDVDTASYTNVRRMLNQNVLPPHGAVRVEEMINYFDYDYPPPTGADPFSVNVAVAECPWNPEHRLARIGIKGKVFTDRNRPAVNLVFLVDVSGSMQDANKLPLVRHGLRAMVEQLTPRDSVAIVTYADGSNVALPATSARNKQTILDAVDRLMSGGGTNGGAGIETAYQLANEHYVEGGANRVILATDGDFNVGVTRQDELVSMIEEKAKTGVFLSVLGFGMGNIKDSMLEKLADKGNGLYAYIDDDVEAERVLVDQMGGTLVTIAKDVKIQVEFNPAEVGAYRLIGYENRMLRAQDFNNDAKDAGEIGAGHTVTALYEIVPAGMQAHEPGVDPLKYQGGESRTATRDAVPGDDTDMVEVDDAESAEEVEDAESVVDAETEASEPRPQGSGQRIVEARDDNAADGGQDAPYTGELMTVKLRYKNPEGDVSKLIELPVTDEGLTIDDASDDFVFAASVASFGMMLRGSAHTPDLSFDSVLEMAKSAMGEDPFGYREEFIQLVEKAKTLSTQKQ